MNFKIIFSVLALANLLSCKQIIVTNLIDESDLLMKNEKCSKFSSLSSNISNGCEVTNEIKFTEFKGSLSTVYIISKASCTGVIVGNRTILTAAHCVVGKENENFKGIIFTGKNPNLKNIEYNKISKIEEIIVHPMYDDSSLSSLADIAIIKTDKNLEKHFNIEIAAVTRSMFENEDAWTFGFGNVSMKIKNKDMTMRWTYFTVSSFNSNLASTYNNKYNKIYNKFSNRGLVNSAIESLPNGTFVITKRTENEHGLTCFGDSGGPQFVERRNGHALLSITQGNNSDIEGSRVSQIMRNKNKDLCTDIDTSISTKISPYIEWINYSIAEWGDRLTIVDE